MISLNTHVTQSHTVFGLWYVWLQKKARMFYGIHHKHHRKIVTLVWNGSDCSWILNFDSTCFEAKGRWIWTVYQPSEIETGWDIYSRTALVLQNWCHMKQGLVQPCIKKEYMKTTDNEIVLCCMYTCEEEKPLYFLLRHTRCISAIIMRKGVLHNTKSLPLLYQTLYDITILSFKSIRLLATLWVWIHYL